MNFNELPKLMQKTYGKYVTKIQNFQAQPHHLYHKTILSLKSENVP